MIIGKKYKDRYGANYYFIPLEIVDGKVKYLQLFGNLIIYIDNPDRMFYYDGDSSWNENYEEFEYNKRDFVARLFEEFNNIKM